ncbi:hypothetical protein [Dialister hominis]|jgi:Flp pilus assembly pilin Flp|uniref:Flp family type IVb pilin n=1 Tax=Dialister hominis TaxID=2582419 RepID=UPI00307E277C
MLKMMIDEIRIMYLSKLGQKGQDLIEYALLLAIVVGIGYLIYTTSGLNDNIQSIFSNAKSVTSSAAAVAKSAP